ncbi:MAG: nucleotidyl transferase AbiEii/AbiGii toxin family protein [Cryobacterium sp.]|nr:nucleotidyl transferase AbiEii/AbiGii toxin family protein [Cryobacterium sp.]
MPWYWTPPTSPSKTSERTTTMRGYRVRIPARVHTHVFSLNLDVSTGDPIRPAPVQIQLPCLLGGHILIAGHPMETVIAEKSVTILQRGTTSTRWRDFVDIRHLARNYPFHAGTLRTAVEPLASTAKPPSGRSHQ